MLMCFCPGDVRCHSVAGEEPRHSSDRHHGDSPDQQEPSCQDHLQRLASVSLSFHFFWFFVSEGSAQLKEEKEYFI